MKFKDDRINAITPNEPTYDLHTILSLMAARSYAAEQDSEVEEIVETASLDIQELLKQEYQRGRYDGKWEAAEFMDKLEKQLEELVRDLTSRDGSLSKSAVRQAITALIEQEKRKAKVEELQKLKESYLQVLPAGPSRDFILIPSLDDRVYDIESE